jgi:cyanate permease
MKLIGDADNESTSQQIRLAFFDWKVLLYMFINIGAVTPVYGLSTFLPSIIKDMDYKNAKAQLLTVPPYVVSGLIAMISSWSAGRLNKRSTHILIFLLVGIGGFLYLILTKQLLYFGAFFACIGVFNSNALVLSWVTNNIGGQTKRAVATALVVAFGSIGGVFSGQIYRASDEPYYHQGHYIVIGIMCFTFILVLLMRLLLMRENRRRKNLTTEQVQEEINAGERQLLLDKVNFVFTTFFF